MFYGVTGAGGSNGFGTVFKMTPTGTLTTLYSFCAQVNCTDGAYPGTGLIQASDGNFYGTTGGGGADCDGTIFKITAGGTLTTLHSFDSTDGSYPTGTLIQATSGSFYGTTSEGGTNNLGTIFKITPVGTLTTLYSFCAQVSCVDGSYPYGGLVQDTDGTFYGTTSKGGGNNEGTVFSLAVGLGPFVETLPTLGKVGAGIRILGTRFTGATSVTFNGTPATFTIESATAIKTTVPNGATTGPVQVATPNGTLTSNVNFQVLP